MHVLVFVYSSRINKWKAMVSISVSEFLCLTPLKGISISIFIVTLRIYNAFSSPLL